MVHTDDDLQYPVLNQTGSRFSSVPIKSLTDELSIDDVRDQCFVDPVLRGSSEFIPELYPVPGVERVEPWGKPRTDSGTSTDEKKNIQFREPPPRHNHRRKKKKKKNGDKNKRKTGSIKTIDSIPASIPEENSEDVISSDPDIDSVEYVKSATLKGTSNTDELVESNQKTVHSVHQIFSELDELVQDQGEEVWEEKARWMKFEQDVYRGADKWSKPHVATLKLQSIISLRKCISQGTVLLGMRAFNLESVIEMTLDRLVSRALITSTVAGQLGELLLKRHVHTGEHVHDSALMFRIKRGKHGISPQSSNQMSRNNSEQDLHKMKQHFLRKLPPDTEASNVMIGRLDYLDLPICVTIRLSHSILLGDMTEVPIPTRFIFLLLCPTSSHIDHVEVGRAASTLFSDESFYKTAYSATSKAHVVQGIDRFLEKAIVIPPSEWNPKMKITVPDDESSAEELQQDQSPTEAELTCSRYTRPLEGMIFDLKALRRRWPGDWRRGAHHWPILCPLQYSLIALSYILMLLQISAQYLHFTPFLCISSAGGATIILAVLSCQPLLLLAPSLYTTLWEMAVCQCCDALDLQYLQLRPVIGIVCGILLVASSLLNLASLLPLASMFVYETLIVALPFVLAGLFVKLAAGTQDELLLLYFAVLMLISVVFLAVWHKFTNSTMFTKKIRSMLKLLNMLLLLGMLVLVTRYTAIHATPYYPATGNYTFYSPAEEEAEVEEAGTLVSRFPSFPTGTGEILAGILAGAALSLLVFLQYGLVFNWVVQPNHKLKRLSGRFYDQFLLGVGFLISGVYRLPFVVPDPMLTVVLLKLLSLTNAASLVLYVREQRAAQFLAGCLMLVPLLAIPNLHIYLPLGFCCGACLFYCALIATQTQLYERFKILLQSEKHHPDKSYLENTPQNVVNSYTIIQIVIVGVLVGLLVSPYTPILLPLLLLLLILIRRYLLPVFVFENLITLLEENKTPVPVSVRCSSPSPSQNAEFSEEVARITNGYQAGSTEPDTMFPQIIFDNLTDDDVLNSKPSDTPTINGCSAPGPGAHIETDSADEYSVAVPEQLVSTTGNSLDFLATDHLTSPGLPFDHNDCFDFGGGEEPKISENPYIATSTYIDCV